jgi:hypothetical protein
LKEKIEIGIPCGRNSEHYVEFLAKTIDKTISKDQKYELLLCVNQSGVDTSRLKQIKKSRLVIEMHNKDSSVGHGMCLDLILKNSKTKYLVICDSDVAFLTYNWDEKLLRELDKKTIMIGTEYHPTDGKIVNFPNVITCAINTEVFKKLNISFMPPMKKIKVNSENASWFGVPLNKEIFLDTGCFLPQVLGENNYNWKTMKIVTPRYHDTIDSMKFMKNNMRGEEYQLNGVPICTHIGRSLTRSFEIDPAVLKWKERVREWFNGQV